jgi:hypothetical protein
MMCDALGFRGWGREAAQVGESSGWLVKPGLVSFFIIANFWKFWKFQQDPQEVE